MSGRAGEIITRQRLTPAMCDVLAEHDETGWVAGNRRTVEGLQARGLVTDVYGVQWSGIVAGARLTTLGRDVSRAIIDQRNRPVGPEIAGGRDANQGAPRPPVPPSEPQ